MSLKNLKQDLRELVDLKKVKFLPQFFKVYKGGYGEGDRFLGVAVPGSRKIAKDYKDLATKELEVLMASPFHEERLVALFILVHRFQKGDEEQKKDVFDFYKKYKKYVNNWDLVDSSAYQIAGAYLYEQDRGWLYELARSKNLWDRRISIISTYAFIKKNDFEDVLEISKILLEDEEDLIHKAVGWMLRETGKRDFDLENNFLKEHYHRMPRTMLRYAIEKFPEKLRKEYLKGKV